LEGLWTVRWFVERWRTDWHWLARVGKAWNQKEEGWQSIRKETGKKILYEETRGKSQEVAVGKLTPLHNYIFFTASQHLR